MLAPYTTRLISDGGGGVKSLILIIGWIENKMDIKLSRTSNQTIAAFVIINIILGIIVVYVKLMEWDTLVLIVFFACLITLVFSGVIIFREEVYKHSAKYLSKAPYEEYKRIRGEQIRRKKKSRQDV